MKQNKRFAIWFADARRAAHLTQEQLAERMGVSQPTIGYWETEGRLWMLPDEIRQLAMHLHVEPVDVAQALGYPVLARATQAQDDLSHLPPDAAEFVRLGERLAELRREWLEFERRLGVPGTDAPESSETGSP